MKINWDKKTGQLTATVNEPKEIKVIWDKHEQTLTVFRGSEKLKTEDSPMGMSVHFFTEYCNEIERVFA